MTGRRGSTSKGHSMEYHRFQDRSPLRIAITLLLAGTLGAPSLARAEPIYKSVDAGGNVTYSSVPPEEAVDTQPVAVPDAPSEARRQQAIEREKQLQRAVESLARERAANDRQRGGAVQDAEQARVEAEARLERAQVIQDSDWQGLAGGGRHLKESYFERVRNAEEELRRAAEAVSKTRRDAR